MREARDLILYFELHNCTGWKTSDDLLRYLQQAIAEGDLIPLENRMIRLEDRKLARPVIEDFERWYKENNQVKENWDQREFRKFDAQEYLGVSLRTTLEVEWRTDQPYWGAIEVSFDGLRFGDAYNYFVLICYLSGGSMASPKGVPQLSRVDEIGKIFVDIARRIISGLEPTYGVITDNPTQAMYGRNILATELDAIHWCNYLGSEYVQKYGEQVFITAPGYEQTRLGKGIWYQITQDFSGSRDEELSVKLADHFSSTGLHKVGNIHYIGSE